MGGPGDAVQVQYTVDDAARGAAIADALLTARLAACVQRIGPIRSRYHWQGGLDEAEEWLFLCKTVAGRADDLVARIAELHPYETPEIIVTPVSAGLERYLRWIEAETGPRPPDRT
jgi:periplasmic divalent cation tolerance protein